MPKTQPNFSWAQILENGTSLYPQLMVSIILGDHENPVPVTAFAAEQSAAQQADNEAKEIGPGSALITCLLFDAVTKLPYLDFVNSATITQDGKIDPGQDIGTKTGIVLWTHTVDDGDSAASWVGGC